MTTIQLENVDVAIGSQQVLHNIHFTLETGTFLGLIGPNGSGKSTLLKTIATLIPTKQGIVTVNRQDIFRYHEKERAKLFSYVPQETVVGFDFTARDIVLMGRHVHGSVFKSTTEEDMQKVDWAMHQTNTYHLADKSVLNLSGGQRQLIMIAKALAQDTEIILLDEPTSALDVFFQLHILTMLKRLCEQGKTMIVVLHDLNLAARFCDKLLLLNNGKVQKYGRVDEVLTEDLLHNIYHIKANVRKDDVTNSLTITPVL